MQNTIATTISGKGIGRAGLVIHFSMKPAPVNTGISVLQTDISRIEVFNSNKIFDSKQRATNSLFNLQSVKPLMAVLKIFGIDNVMIEICGNELPAMDGCAELFVFLVKSAGRESQYVARDNLYLLQPIVVSDRGGWIRMFPNSRFRIACLNASFQASFPVHNFGAMIDFSQTVFVAKLCRARPLVEIKKQWRVLDVEHLSVEVRQNRERNLINEFNHRELLESIYEISVFGMNFTVDYVSFNADDRLRSKLFTTLTDNASLYFSTKSDDDNGVTETKHIEQSLSLIRVKTILI